MEVPEPLAVQVETAARMTGVSRTEIYKAIKNLDLKSLKIGKRRLIRVDALREWLAAVEQCGSRRPR
jgi:excisionase family DNA binding protein